MVAAKKGASRGASDAAPPDSGSKASSVLKKKKSDMSSGLPWWVWLVGIVALIAVLGQVFSGGDSAPARTKVKKGGKKGGKKAEKGSTQAYLTLALRLQEMTSVSTALKAANQLDGEAAKTLDDELNDIEKEIGDMEGSIARDLRSMVTVIRGTLYQQSHNLTDEQVEKMNNSFTYANPRYWDEYYKKLEEGERFDWYLSWNTAIKDVPFAPMDSGTPQSASKVGDIVGAYIKKESKILMLGCGNSDMSELMYKDGFEQIVNIDISEQLMQGLRDKQEAAMPKMQWLYMNASAMTFDTGSFDVTVDKGTLDAMEQNRDLVLGAVREAHRTLRSGGLFISVTFNPASVRIDAQLQKDVRWSSCHTHPISKKAVPSGTDKNTDFFVHACVKP